MRFLRTPLFVALLISTAGATILSVLLYLNEDWRRTTYAIIEEITNEDGEKVKRVKVERPKPNREQIEEIARNREKKKREELKEKVRELEESLTEIEIVAELRREEVDGTDDWDRLATLAFEIELMSKTMNQRVSEVEALAQIPYSVSGSLRIREVATRNAEEIRQLAEEEITLEQAFGQLGNSHEMVALMNILGEMIEEKYRELRKEKKDRGNMVRDINKVSGQFMELGEEYLVALEELVYGFVPEEAEFALHEEMEEPEPEDLLSDFMDTTEPLTDEELEAMSTSEMYETIQDLATAVDESFAENRAAELAAAENISFEEAQDKVFKPETDTGPELGEALAANDPSDLESFESFNEALDQATRAAEIMARTAANRSSQIMGESGEAGSETRQAEALQEALQQRSRIRSEMSMLASNDGRQQGNVQDMRQLMANSYSLSSSQSGDSLGLDGVTLQMSSNTDLSQGGDSKTSSKTNTVRLSQNKVLRQAIPGRRLDMSAGRKGWIFLDTWYVIGPWDRPKTNSFDTPFPPETLIDLDAEYVGKVNPKTGEPLDLEWRFVQTENIRINPPDEIGDSVYYAFTEVFSEKAMEVMIAVASDDIAKLWINDLVVWQDEGLSSWRLDEGFRRILLRPGYNTVLIRVENGPAVCYFSVLMCPAEILASQ